MSDFDTPDTGGPAYHAPPPSYGPPLPPPPFPSPPRERRRWPAVVAITVVLAGLAATGGILYANDKAPFTDSGVETCKAMAAGLNENRGNSAGDTNNLDRAKLDKVRAAFAGSRHTDLAAAGVTFVDDVIGLSAPGAAQGPSQIFDAMAVTGDFKALAAACANYGVAMSTSLVGSSGNGETPAQR
jgi:hypothetical protein